MTLSHLLFIIPLFLSLGLDTFAVAIGLGISGLDRRQRLRFGLSFALAEGIMPLVGFLLGQTVASRIGDLARYLAALLLLAVGLYAIWEARQGKEPELEAASPLTLLVTALSVSMDELAVGFGLGLLHVPIAPAVAYIAAQAFVLTMLGSSLGGRLGGAFGERAELLSGVVLTALAVVLLMGAGVVGS